MIDITTLPEHLQDMAMRIAMYKPALRHCKTLPGMHIGFSHAFFAENQLLLGDLRIDISWQDTVRLFRFALKDAPLTIEVEDWDKFYVA